MIVLLLVMLLFLEPRQLPLTSQVRMFRVVELEVI